MPEATETGAPKPEQTKLHHEPPMDADPPKHDVPEPRVAGEMPNPCMIPSINLNQLLMQITQFDVLAAALDDLTPAATGPGAEWVVDDLTPAAGGPGAEWVGGVAVLPPMVGPTEAAMVCPTEAAMWTMAWLETNRVLWDDATG